MNLKLFSLRAAISSENTVTSITENTCELYTTVLHENKIKETDIVSLQISITADLDAINPATALRSKNLAKNISLFCSQEAKYRGSKPKIIRFMILLYAEEAFTAKNIYLKNASQLREDMLNSSLSDEKNKGEAKKEKKLWIVSREYAGIAEAGGLKNVVKALAENASEEKIAVCVFMPKYPQGKLEGEKTLSIDVPFNNKKYPTEYFEADMNGVHFVLIQNEFYSSKQGIYTYTEREATACNDGCIKKGTAYADTDKMNLSFQFAILEYAKKLTKEDIPNVLHCHDAHSAFLPALIENDVLAKTLFDKTTFFLTIHNAGDAYRQQLWNMDYAFEMTGISKNLLETACVENGIEPFLLSAKYARLTTVSPCYAKELKDLEYSPFSYNFSKALKEKNIDIIGITNGIDYKSYDPKNTSLSKLTFAYNPLKADYVGKYENRKFFLEKLKEKTHDTNKSFDNLNFYGSLAESSEKLLYFAYHGRIVHQKGIDILLKTIQNISNTNKNLRFLIMGQGTADYEAECIRFSEVFKGQLIYFKGYNKKIARFVTAISDFILLPSLFEPCGLEDFISQVYATIPIAHAIGGLKKIIDGETGFLFKVDNAKNMEERFSVELLSNAMAKIIQKLTNDFMLSNKKYLLDEKKFSDMIVKANDKILELYNWKKIVTERYFPLYGF